MWGYLLACGRSQFGNAASPRLKPSLSLPSRGWPLKPSHSLTASGHGG
nr:MAG TPA_asm: hypothetical protein [Caudoviricetes sp.]